VNVENVVSAGAEFVRVHFSRFRLAPNDYLTIADPKGSRLEILQGQGPHDDGDVWSFAVPGDTAVLTLHAGPRTNASNGEAQGYEVDTSCTAPCRWVRAGRETAPRSCPAATDLRVAA
jgi:hypothetical protein